MEKREVLKPVVAVGNTIALMARFVVQKLDGGWADLADRSVRETTPANITIYREDPKEREADL